MKVIDLLNKIANGEEVPKRIKYCDEMFLFTGYNSASKNYSNELEDLFEVLDGSMLNDEVEILEEEKKIPEKLKIEQDGHTYNNFYIVNQNGTKCYLTKHSKMIAETLNQVIDYLKSKGDE